MCYRGKYHFRSSYTNGGKDLFVKTISKILHISSKKRNTKNVHIWKTEVLASIKQIYIVTYKISVCHQIK